MNKFRLTFASSTVFLALGLATSAHAGSSNSSMAVTATVINNCTVVASPMAFGTTLTTVGSANIDSSATLALVCTPNASYYVAMDDGANVSGGVRRMKGTLNGAYLPYEIYADSSRSQRWGQNQGTNTVGGNAGATGSTTLTAYGRIPASASAVSADAYTDTVTVTVNF